MASDGDRDGDGAGHVRDGATGRVSGRRARRLTILGAAAVGVAAIALVALLAIPFPWKQPDGNLVMAQRDAGANANANANANV